ncbi:hypothetical protein HNY73_014056 [Argiope bruennichi]|uniref:Uncharacterized protein n=1 Tax=Argiope bruennichi TaxID=94029 RepID=A0A8T0EN22_ARGBR|nr:hypothetical protein HNY73_014056 [Argiope bruennichi]
MSGRVEASGFESEEKSADDISPFPNERESCCPTSQIGTESRYGDYLSWPTLPRKVLFHPLPPPYQTLLSNWLRAIIFSNFHTKRHPRKEIRRILTFPNRGIADITQTRRINISNNLSFPNTLHRPPVLQAQASEFLSHAPTENKKDIFFKKASKLSRVHCHYILTHIRQKLNFGDDSVLIAYAALSVAVNGDTEEQATEVPFEHSWPASVPELISTLAAASFACSATVARISSFGVQRPPSKKGMQRKIATC